jgi:hypothetical protein
VNLLTDYNLLTEYLERMLQLENLAVDEPDSTFKAQLLMQARAYRKLADQAGQRLWASTSGPARKYELEHSSNQLRTLAVK